MLVAPFYVMVQNDWDKEIIPCADLKTAKYCVEHLKKYDFKDYEIQILKGVKQDDDS